VVKGQLGKTYPLVIDGREVIARTARPTIRECGRLIESWSLRVTSLPSMRADRSCQVVL